MGALYTMPWSPWRCFKCHLCAYETGDFQQGTRKETWMYDALEKHVKDHHTCKWCNFRPLHEKQVFRKPEDGTVYWLHWKKALETHQGHCRARKKKLKKIEKQERIMKQKAHAMALEYLALRVPMNDDILRKIKESI